ncbi:MAG TPA: hypothetical protein VGU20_23185 [Stellaceae bacterium]|nr:hypothetical protein [Stellaceae bacterium]
MATKRQIKANRENSLKSTGPTSREGKRASSKNALKHGLRAEQNVFFDEETEEYQALEDALLDEFLPVGAIEEHLVCQLVNRIWQQRRIPRIEAGLVAGAAAFVKACIEQYRKEVAERASPRAEPDRSPIPAISAGRAFEELASDGKIPLLQLLARYAAAADRGFFRDLRELEHRQAKRKKTSTSRNEPMMSTAPTDAAPGKVSTVFTEPAKMPTAPTDGVVPAKMPMAPTDAAPSNQLSPAMRQMAEKIEKSGRPLPPDFGKPGFGDP